ncbi:hypothetical protein [Mycolicibacter longobardus]|uniref:Mce protein n=1 Tax=Mycolicibacter longobardus TaxID=1108812 RepID=A0A1X1YRQ0_9MYCO|nr:hypothetical protein [Mycolicibacter longobardus]MCV7383428.1 Mce protein [Mycolicibacter longobardus]ORW13786.1 hypothetical protein AWC16_03195 [Mycolicibacter longobardus]
MPDTQLLTEPEVLGVPPGDADDTTVPASRKRLPHLTTGALTLLVVTLAALCGCLAWQNKSDRDIQVAGAAARQAAQDYAATLTSVDSNNLDANFAAVLEGSTGEFHDMYRQSSSQLRQMLIARKATGHGVVIDSAIKSATRDQVVVLLFVDQTVTNTDVPDPRVDRSRIIMTMQRIDGQWKAAKVELP